MAFFPVPANPTEAEVADALSLAVVSGLMGRRRAGVAGVSMEEAFASASRYREEVVRSARGWFAENQSLGGSEADAATRLQSAITMASAVVSGLISRHVSPDQALLQVSRMRERVWPSVRGLENPNGGANPETPAAATLMAGALQGEVVFGTDPVKALSGLRGRSHEFTAAARNLMGALQAKTSPEADLSQPLSVASGMYATALAGLVGRGETLSDALITTRSQREGLVNKSLDLTGTPPAVDLPAAQQWRQGREPGAGVEAESKPKGPAA